MNLYGILSAGAAMPPISTHLIVWCRRLPPNVCQARVQSFMRLTLPGCQQQNSNRRLETATTSIIGVLAEDGRPHRTWCGAEHGARWPRRTWRGDKAHPQAEGLRQESLLQMFGVQEFHEERPTEREAEMARPALPGDPLTLALPVSFCFAPLPLALPFAPVGFNLADWPLGKTK